MDIVCYDVTTSEGKFLSIPVNLNSTKIELVCDLKFLNHIILRPTQTRNIGLNSMN